VVITVIPIWWFGWVFTAARLHAKSLWMKTHDRISMSLGFFFPITLVVWMIVDLVAVLWNVTDSFFSWIGDTAYNLGCKL
jgi:hypothetical protein